MKYMYAVLGIGILIIGVFLYKNSSIARSIKKPLPNSGVLISSTTAESTGDKKAPTQQEASSPSFYTLQSKENKFTLAPELVSPDGYLNTNDQPITLAQYRGHSVVLLEFWTYSCINCQRTLPYVTRWYSTYKDQGLVVIGVHTPEFAYEHLKENVAKALVDEGITYPVVLDNEYQTWRSYSNQYWPHTYLIDVDGYIVYDHIGEGAYDETEQAIQKALAERNARM